MKRTLAALIFVCLPAVAAPRPMFVVELHGTPYERGLQHGRALKEPIQRYVVAWKAGIKEEMGSDPDAFAAAFLRDRDFMAATRRWMPEMIDEVRGIADGAAIPFETAWAIQLGDELWVYESEQKAMKPANHCSAVGVPRAGSHPAYVAQNMDIEPYNEGFQTVLHIAEENGEPEQTIFTVTGGVALNGVNNRSIGVVVNTLGQLQPSRDGLPVSFVIRGVLRARNAKEAIAFLKSVRHASGQNYIVGAGDRIYDFEASANKVVAYAPHGEGNAVCHTNHPLVNDDYNDRYHGPKSQNSANRLRSLDTRIGRDADAEGIAAALRSHDVAEDPVCRPWTPTKDFTFGSTIMTLSGKPSIDVSNGPPDANAYQRFELTSKR